MTRSEENFNKMPFTECLKYNFFFLENKKKFYFYMLLASDSLFDIEKLNIEAVKLNTSHG